jgi:CubicO group peptidase (beta-lactamase class C family)
MIRVEPEDVGLSTARLRRIGSVMQTYIDEGKIPGLSVMLARRGKIAYAECFGKRDDPEVPMTQDTICQIFSMTKPIVSVAVLMLYEEGRFQLNDPVSHYIPEFQDTKVYVEGDGDRIVLADQERPMSIRHLLTHSSGLHYPWKMAPTLLPLLEEARLDDPERTTQDFVKELARLPLSFQPGTSWAYGQSHDVLGYLVEVISGMPLDVFLKQRIFGPLGMPDTGFDVPPDKIGRFAAQYEVSSDGFKLVESPASSRKAKPARLMSGGGGLVSTVSDYARFAQMLLNGGELDGARLLGRKTVDLMTTNHLSPVELSAFESLFGYYSKGYGYGLGVRTLLSPAENELAGSVGSFGWSGVHNTHFWVDPQEELFGFVWGQYVPQFFYPIDRQSMVLAYQQDLADRRLLADPAARCPSTTGCGQRGQVDWIACPQIHFVWTALQIDA